MSLHKGIYTGVILGNDGMAIPEKTTVSLNVREQRMIGHHMRDTPGIWDTPSDWVHDAVRVFHLVLQSGIVKDIVFKAIAQAKRHHEGETGDGKHP